MIDLIFPKQYIFCGTSSTGKTTALRRLQENRKFRTGYYFNTGSIRELATNKGYNLNENGTMEGQRDIFNMYKDWFHEHRNQCYVSDRSLIDVLAYTFYLVEHKGVDPDLFDVQNETIQSLIQRGYLTHVFYFPINFELSKDGVRSEDELYRREIDMYIRGFLTEYKNLYPDKFNFTIIKKGTPEEVENQIVSTRV